MVQEIAILEPGGNTRQVPLDRDRIRIGRSSDNDLSFPGDMSLSRHHLVLERRDDGWCVEDLGAKNRTTLNGRRIEGKTPLVAGDRISAGQVVVVFGGKSSTGPVEFTQGGDDGPLRATVMTNLRGVLSRESTMPGVSKPVSRGERRGLPLEHPGVAALIRAGQELAGHRPLDELFELILDLSIQAVGAERGVLMTLEGEDLVVRSVRGEGFRISTTVRDRVLDERASLLVRDTALDEAFKSRDSIVGQQVQSVMAVPLQTNDRVIGLINVDSRSFARPFTPDDLDLLTVLANVAAIRIENERLAVVELQKQIITRARAGGGDPTPPPPARGAGRRRLRTRGAQPAVPDGRWGLLRFLPLRGRPHRARPGRRQRQGDAGRDPDEHGQGGDAGLVR